MKMRHEHFKGLRSLIVPRPYTEWKNRGFSEMRWRWDHLWAIPPADRQAWFDQGIYDYLDDSHIDTALRKILKGPVR